MQIAQGREFLETAGFRAVQSWIVDRENQAPGLETILAIGRKEEN